MRLFELQRIEDESGVSGTGTVAQGVIFDNGWCALTWLTEHTSVAFYTSLVEVEAIHGHNGKTKIVMVDAVLASALRRQLVAFDTMRDTAIALRRSLLGWAKKLEQFSSTRDWISEMKDQAGPEI